MITCNRVINNYIVCSKVVRHAFQPPLRRAQLPLPLLIRHHGSHARSRVRNAKFATKRNYYEL